MVLAPGPYAQVPIEHGVTAPFYALRFDTKGRSEGPKTQHHLVGEATANHYTDVYVFSHGWNNDWKTALKRYNDFFEQFRSLREVHGLDFNRPYRPLLAGVIWPSTALVMPWEQGPEFAGDDDVRDAEAVDLSLIEELALRVSDDAMDQFYELVERDTHRQGTLSEDRIHRLEASAGWTWDTRNQT